LNVWRGAQGQSRFQIALQRELVIANWHNVV
jgi:hypothetical protein